MSVTLLNQKKLIKSPETYFYLNNLVNIPVNGEIPLHRDQEALKAYFEEEIIPNTLLFDSLEEKLTFMIENNYIDVAILNLYTQAKNNEYDNAFIKSLFKKIYAANFKFKSFMGAYKFYSQYALKTNDNLKYLERFEDRVAFNALYLGNGDKQLAMQLAEELISQRYQPATPTFLNAGKKKRGEMISCFLIDIGDSMLSIGRGVNSALQLSRIGGGVE